MRSRARPPRRGSCRAVCTTWCMGMPPTRLKAFRTTIGRCLPGKHAGRSLTWRLAVHQCDPIHPCRIEPIVAWAEAVHKAWRRQQRLVGLSVARRAPLPCAWGNWVGHGLPHHTTFITAAGHEVHSRKICPRDVKAQATVDSKLALWREWADNDERKDLLPCPLLKPVVMANK